MNKRALSHHPENTVLHEPGIPENVNVANRLS